MRTVTGPSERVVVVGAGLAGLSAAIHLAAAGRSVTVLESAGGPGGLAGRAEQDGFAFDTGPTVLTGLDIIDATFAALGERRADWLDLVALDPIYIAHFADRPPLPISADPARTAASIADFAGLRAARGFERLLEWLGELAAVEFRSFIDTNIDSPASLLGTDLARLIALGGFRRLDAAVARFIADPALRRVFTFQSLYVGLSPYRALALYAVISYLDTVRGVVFPRGGMAALPAALAAVAAAAGVRFRYHERVCALKISGGRVTALRTQAGTVPADAVVLAIDAPQAARLVGCRRRRLRTAPSCVLLHLGTDPDRCDAHHTISFGRAWRGTFDELITRRTLMSDPSLLVSNPTRTDASLAAYGDIRYVLAPAPNTRSGIDWAAIGPRYRDEIVATLRQRGLLASGTVIRSEVLMTPADWAGAGLPDGAPFAAAHTIPQTGPFRPPNLMRGVENLVLAGAWTHPGVGVPMVLISGRLAAERVTGTAGTPSTARL